MGAAPILTILKDGETVRSLPIEGEVLLGRSQGCVIRLEDRAISRQHAVFRAVAEGVQVERKSEFAPLLVNGADCTSAIIKEGDVIEIGPYLMRLNLKRAEQEKSAQEQAAALSASEGAVVAEPGGAAPPADGASAGASMPSFGDPAAISIIGSGAGSEEDSGEAAAAAEAGLAGGVPAVLESPGADPFASPAAEAPAPPPADTGTSVLGVDEDAKTRLTTPEKVSVKLLFQEGDANATEYELSQDEISIGRGKNCDVVLRDKKSSRKNSIIRRAGMSFVIKDLGSANGTYVNGVRVEEQELSGDDVIQVGDVEFQFKVLSADYAAREKDFLAVEPEPASESSQLEEAGASLDLSPLAPGADPMLPSLPDVPGMAPVPGLPGAAEAPAAGSGHSSLGIQSGGAVPGLIGIPGVAGASTKPKGLMEKFRALPKSRQYMWIAIVLGFGLLTYLQDEEETMEAQKAQSAKSAQAQKKGAKGGQGKVTGVTFQTLTPEQKKFVESQHTLAFDLYKARDYDKAIFEIEKIFALGLEDYKDSREILRYAQEGKRKLEAIESEKRHKQEEARIKARVAQLEIEGSDLLTKRAYPQLQEIMAELLSLDPENANVAKWKAALEQEQEELRARQQRAQVRGEIDKEAWRIHRAGTALFKQGKYRSAFETYQKVAEVGSADPQLKKLNDRMIRKSLAAIKATLKPVLEEARQAETAGELAKAFKLYLKATQIDPPHKEGYLGMNRIRGVLHEKAKSMYTEAILAESYSDFTFAKKKFQEIMDTTPVEDIYYERAVRKLGRYMKREEAPQ